MIYLLNFSWGVHVYIIYHAPFRGYIFENVSHMCIIAERLSVRQIILHRISRRVCMYVCMYVSRLGMRATRKRKHHVRRCNA